MLHRNDSSNSSIRVPTQRQPTDKVRVRANLHTLALGGIVIAMWYAGSVQSNGAATLLAFIAGTIGVISYVHARANLRGLGIQAGALPPLREGQQAWLPITLHAATAASPYGVELLIVGSKAPALVDQLQSGETIRMTLKLPPIAAGGRRDLHVLFRSAYPLGLFSAERLVEIPAIHGVIPKPAGLLPLPVAHSKPDANASGLTSLTSDATRTGDDFAGLRLWQPGDSPRHIDWRAAARGRPLMVKTWAGGADESVHLDWHEIPLPEEQRPGQIAQWIQDCEAQGTAYSVNLPGISIPAGLGTTHQRRCLHALARLGQESGSRAVEARKEKTSRVPASFERSVHLPRGPLIWLCGALLLASAPLTEIVSPVVLALLALCFTVRIFFVRPGSPKWVPLLAMIGGIAMVWLIFGEIESLEARVSALLVLLSAKLLESRTPHDFQVLAMIGWFLCLCGLLIEQSLLRSVFTIGVCGLITACMVRFRRGVPGMTAPFLLTGRLFAQALPVAALLFFIFPRFGLEDLARFGSQRITRTGIPPELNPGAVAAIAKTDDTAFRVKFPDGPPPPNNQRYWRCLVMWRCEGLRWSPDRSLAASPVFRFAPQSAVRQVIALEPHGHRWLPALDWPIRAHDSHGLMEPGTGETLTSFDPVLNLRRFEVLSRLQSEPGKLPDAHRRAALQVPGDVAPRLRALAQGWRTEARRNDALVVQSALRYFSTQGFQYALDPGEYDGDTGLEDFLLRRRVGFCEHFSAAFATLMRLAGVPCRVVVGYLGGELSERSGHMTVKQSDAHAWTEVWLESVGWARVDPTAALAPARVSGSLQTFLQGGDEALARQRSHLWWRFREAARLFWQDINNAWYDEVISFDEDTQRDWFMWAGVDRVQKSTLLATSGAVMLAALAALTLWLRRPARHPDPWARAWERLGRKLSRRGLPPRHANEGPLAYAQRLIASHPGIDIRPLAHAYAAARYGQAAKSLRDFNRSVRNLRK